MGCLPPALKQDRAMPLKADKLSKSAGIWGDFGQTSGKAVFEAVERRLGDFGYSGTLTAKNGAPEALMSLSGSFLRGIEEVCDNAGGDFGFLAEIWGGRTIQRPNFTRQDEGMWAYYLLC